MKKKEKIDKKRIRLYGWDYSKDLVGSGVGFLIVYPGKEKRTELTHFNDAWNEVFQTDGKVFIEEIDQYTEAYLGDGKCHFKFIGYL